MGSSGFESDTFRGDPRLCKLGHLSSLAAEAPRPSMGTPTTRKQLKIGRPADKRPTAVFGAVYSKRKASLFELCHVPPGLLSHAQSLRQLRARMLHAVSELGNRRHKKPSA